MTTVTGVSSAQSTTSARLIQLGLGLIAMMSISSPQYVWTLFTKPLQEAVGGAPLSAIQVTFTLVIVLQPNGWRIRQHHFSAPPDTPPI